MDGVGDSLWDIRSLGKGDGLGGEHLTGCGIVGLLAALAGL